ncbi:MAG: 30S ribosomal protein S8e [Candidatus Aenigmatarchaeota archaeon]
MSITRLKSKRKLTGGLYKKQRKKRKSDFGKDFFPPKIGKERRKTIDGLARNKKERLFEVEKANVSDGSGKAKVVKILHVEKNPANPHFVRMSIVTKGAIIKTELGMAKVVSRPGQHGVVNAVLVKEKE